MSSEPKQGGSAALRADAVQLHVATVDAETGERGALVEVHVELIEVDIPDLATPGTDEVMVIVGIDLELHCRAGPFERTNQPGTNQFVDVPVDRGMRDRWQGPAYFTHQIVGGRVTSRFAQNAEEDVPLRREPKPTRRAFLAEVRIPFGGGQHVGMSLHGERGSDK
jgi:hypothetical protein